MSRKLIDDVCSRPMALYGAATLRIGYGIAGGAYYLRNYGDRRYLWGPEGVYPVERFRAAIFRPGFSLYEWASNEFVFEFIFHSGIVTCILFFLGVGGRLTTAAHYVFVISLFLRNPALLDGGDNLSYLVLLYLLPVNCTAVLSIRRTEPVPKGAEVAVVLHNMGIVLIALQIFILYLASAMYKIQGRLWQDGTALYYIWRVPEFSWPLVTDHLVRYGWLIVMATYFSVLFQLLFPVLVAIRETRVATILMAVLFHATIGITMGLTSFSIYMVATEAIFLSDRHYAWLGGAIDRGLETLFVKSRQVAERMRRCIMELLTNS